MEFFRNAKTVRLKSCHGQYLCGKGGRISALDSESLEQRAAHDAETRREDWWSVEFVVNSDSDSVLCLKSSSGLYLHASDQRYILHGGGGGGGMVKHCAPFLGGGMFEHSSLLYSSYKWKPVMVGTQVKLRTHYGSFLNARQNGDITHDISHNNTILWDVEVVEREQEGSATNVDDKALEEGSATKRRHETGEGSSVAKNPKGDSGLTREDDRVKYRRHFWNLKIKLWDESGRTDVLVIGGSGTTALVREVCFDVREQFDTIVWIGIPQENDSALSTEEMLLQLIFERMVFPECFDEKRWMLVDSEFSLEQKPRCLVVVDNLDDPRTCKKFEEILRKVKTCSVIFIARREMDKLSSLLKQYGRESDPHKYVVKDLSYVPRKDGLKSFLEETSTSQSKGVCQLIVKKCERLPTAIVFVLREQKGDRRIDPDKAMGCWEATIPSADCRRELNDLRRALNLIKNQERKADYKATDLHKVLKILRGNEYLFCFLYLCILPRNSSISCQRVSRLWAAEGCLPKDLKPQQIFKHLLEEKLIYSEETRRDGELSSFKVHCVQHIIASLSNLSIDVSTTHLGCTHWPGKLECLSFQGTIGPLSSDENRSCELSRISALEVSIDEDRTTTFEASSNLKHHKVLDLTGAPFKFIPRELFERTTDVRYLSLRNTSIKVIPRSIRKLRQLRFLDAKQSLVTNLPQAVEGLKNICQILIYHHEKDPLMESNKLIGFKASCRIGGLTSLEKLCFVESDDRILEDLKNLTKLRRLGITKLKKDDGEKLCSSLEKLEKLESLNIHAFDEDEIIDLHRLSSPPKSLKRLYLHGRLEELPGWIKSPHALKKIILTWSQIGEGEGLLATLGDVKKLSELELRRAYDGERLDFKEGQFRELKILLLDELGGLRSVSFEKKTLSNLEELTISRCQWLESVPSGIGRLLSLRKLTFFDMSHEFYEKIKADHEKDGYKIFQNIKEVYFTRWRAGCWETVPF